MGPQYRYLTNTTVKYRGKDQNVFLSSYKGISEILCITNKIQTISKASGNQKDLKYPE